MITRDQNPFICLYAIGVIPTLDLSSEEVNALTAEDLVLLRECGAGEPLLDRLRTLAQEPGRALRLDFETQTVSLTPDV
jgi:hypothetical protein